MAASRDDTAPRALTIGAALTAAALGASVLTANTLPTVRGHGSAVTLRRDLSRVTSPTSHPGTGRVRTPTPATQYVDAIAAPVIAAVAQGAQTRLVPVNLVPALDRAYRSKAQPFLDGCDNSFTDAEVHPCTYGPTTAATTIVMFGDSHAAEWFPAVDGAAESRGWRIVNLSKATCPPIALPIYSPVLHRQFHECDSWRSAALARIEQERPSVVIIDVTRHYGPEYNFLVYGSQWINGLHDVVARIRATGARVIVLGPTPRPLGDVPDCLAQHLDDVPACMNPRSGRPTRWGGRGATCRRTDGRALIVDVAPWVCTASTCDVIVGNLLVYSDDNHLTVEYVKWIAPLVVAQIDVVSGRRGLTTTCECSTGTGLPRSAGAAPVGAAHASSAGSQLAQYLRHGGEHVAAPFARSPRPCQQRRAGRIAWGWEEYKRLASATRGGASAAIARIP